ncbi:MAG TPA: Rne/Rng family ribonuclease [Polyangia bacterium]|nr:Rne/Rng family ribonuclease [Polyangia bacterium]
MAGNTLVVNAEGPEIRVALIEKGILSEVYIERKRERGLVGNIYMGRVSRVLPGMQAAFVDIGVEKAAFLYVADVRGSEKDMKAMFLEDEDERAEEDDLPRDELARQVRNQKIEDLLKEGQQVMVQVAKDPIGTKGARSTTYIALPGRHLVYMPTVDHVGISRRITSEKERRRLREIVDSMRPRGTGFIVRTVAEGVPEVDLRADMEFLIKLWGDIGARAQGIKAPKLLYKDLDLLLRTVRDTFTEDVDKLIIDERPEYDRVLKFVKAFMPQFQHKVELYAGREPIFDGYGIEAEIDRALERKVWLKSGGYLIIDQAEAATVIDVNTGKFVGKRKSTLEETLTKNNLEAAREVAEQLRLRNLGGIIIVDFIDMDHEKNRRKVTQAFEEALRADRAKTSTTKISEFGLVEMTRKRTRESLGRLLTEPCFYCEGKGYLKSKMTICYEILRELRRNGDSFDADTLVVTAHPDIAHLLATHDGEYVDELEKRLQKRITVRAKPGLHLEEYEIGPAKKEREQRRERREGGDGRPDAPAASASPAAAEAEAESESEKVEP